MVLLADSGEKNKGSGRHGKCVSTGYKPVNVIPDRASAPAANDGNYSAAVAAGRQLKGAAHDPSTLKCV